MEIASPVSSYRLAKVPGSKVETVERKKMVGTFLLAGNLDRNFPLLLSPSAFFIPLFITPSLKVSLSSFVTLIQRATRPGNFSREGEGNFAAAILRAARCNFSQGKRAKIPAAFLLKNEGTGQERESTKESRGGNVTAMVSRIFKEGKGGS